MAGRRLQPLRVLEADPNHVRAKVGLRDVVASQTMYFDEDHERREDRRAQVLRTPISEFELSVRSRNCLSATTPSAARSRLRWEAANERRRSRTVDRS